MGLLMFLLLFFITTSNQLNSQDNKIQPIKKSDNVISEKKQTRAINSKLLEVRSLLNDQDPDYGLAAYRTYESIKWMQDSEGVADVSNVQIALSFASSALHYATAASFLGFNQGDVSTFSTALEKFRQDLSGSTALTNTAIEISTFITATQNFLKFIPSGSIFEVSSKLIEATEKLTTATMTAALYSEGADTLILAAAFLRNDRGGADQAFIDMNLLQNKDQTWPQGIYETAIMHLHLAGAKAYKASAIFSENETSITDTIKEAAAQANFKAGNLFLLGQYRKNASISYLKSAFDVMSKTTLAASDIENAAKAFNLVVDSENYSKKTQEGLLVASLAMSTVAAAKYKSTNNISLNAVTELTPLLNSIKVVLESLMKNDGTIESNSQDLMAKAIIYAKATFAISSANLDILFKSVAPASGALAKIEVAIATSAIDTTKVTNYKTAATDATNSFKKFIEAVVSTITTSNFAKANASNAKATALKLASLFETNDSLSEADLANSASAFNDAANFYLKEGQYDQVRYASYEAVKTTFLAELNSLSDSSFRQASIGLYNSIQWFNEITPDTTKDSDFVKEISFILSSAFRLASAVKNLGVDLSLSDQSSAFVNGLQALDLLKRDFESFSINNSNISFISKIFDDVIIFFDAISVQYKAKFPSSVLSSIFQNAAENLRCARDAKPDSSKPEYFKQAANLLSQALSLLTTKIGDVSGSTPLDLPNKDIATASANLFQAASLFEVSTPNRVEDLSNAGGMFRYSGDQKNAKLQFLFSANESLSVSSSNISKEDIGRAAKSLFQAIDFSTTGDDQRVIDGLLFSSAVLHIVVASAEIDIQAKTTEITLGKKTILDEIVKLLSGTVASPSTAFNIIESVLRSKNLTDATNYLVLFNEIATTTDGLTTKVLNYAESIFPETTVGAVLKLISSGATATANSTPTSGVLSQLATAKDAATTSKAGTEPLVAFTANTADTAATNYYAAIGRVTLSGTNATDPISTTVLGTGLIGAITSPNVVSGGTYDKNTFDAIEDNHTANSHLHTAIGLIYRAIDNSGTAGTKATLENSADAFDHALSEFNLSGNYDEAQFSGLLACESILSITSSTITSADLTLFGVYSDHALKQDKTDSAQVVEGLRISSALMFIVSAADQINGLTSPSNVTLSPTNSAPFAASLNSARNLLSMPNDKNAIELKQNILAYSKVAIPTSTTEPFKTIFDSTTDDDSSIFEKITKAINSSNSALERAKFFISAGWWTFAISPTTALTISLSARYALNYAVGELFYAAKNQVNQLDVNNLIDSTAYQAIDQLLEATDSIAHGFFELCKNIDISASTPTDLNVSFQNAATLIFEGSRAFKRATALISNELYFNHFNLQSQIASLVAGHIVIKKGTTQAALTVDDFVFACTYFFSAFKLSTTAATSDSLLEKESFYILSIGCALAAAADLIDSSLDEIKYAAGTLTNFRTALSDFINSIIKNDTASIDTNAKNASQKFTTYLKDIFPVAATGTQNSILKQLYNALTASPSGAIFQLNAGANSSLSATPTVQEKSVKNTSYNNARAFISTAKNMISGQAETAVKISGLLENAKSESDLLMNLFS